MCDCRIISLNCKILNWKYEAEANLDGVNKERSTTDRKVGKKIKQIKKNKDNYLNNNMENTLKSCS